MSTNVECPDCGKVLKPANPIAPGKKVRCPGCKTIFTMPAANGAKKPPAANGQRVAAKPPAANAPGSPKAGNSAIQARKRTMLAKAPVDDDEDEAPVRRRPKNEAPLSRKRKPRDEEDYDEREDEDERDDEEEDRPKKKKKKKSKGPSPVLLLSAGGGGLAVVLLLVAAFLWPGFLRSGPTPTPPVAGPGPGPAPAPVPVPEAPKPAQVLALIPANSTLVVGVDFEMLRKDPLGKNLDKQLMDAMALDPGDGRLIADLLKDTKKLVVGLDAFFGSGPLFDGPGQDSTGMAVFQADGPFSNDKVRRIFEGGGYDARKGQGKVVYASQKKAGEFGGVFNERILLSGKMPEDQFTQLLNGDGATIRLGPDMQATIAGVDKAPVWVALAMEGKIKEQLQSIPPEALADIPDLQAALSVLQAAKGLTLSVEFASKEVVLNVGVHCASDETAAGLKKAADDFWTKQGSLFLGMGTAFLGSSPESKALKDAVNQTSKSLKFASKGSVATASLRISQQAFAKFQDAAMNIKGLDIGPPQTVTPPPPKKGPFPPKEPPSVEPPPVKPPPVKPPDPTKPPKTVEPKKKDTEKLLAELAKREQREILPLEADAKLMKSYVVQAEQTLQNIKTQLAGGAKLPPATRQKLQFSAQQLQQALPAMNAKLQAAEQRVQQKRQEFDQERQKIMAAP